MTTLAGMSLGLSAVLLTTNTPCDFTVREAWYRTSPACRPARRHAPAPGFCRGRLAGDLSWARALSSPTAAGPDPSPGVRAPP